MKIRSLLRAAALIALLTETAVIAGCTKKQAAAMSGPFPDSNQVSGWTKIGNPRTFAAADLWQYIDGAAEKYVKAGVQSTSTADYKFEDKIEAVADVYTMSNSGGAKTVFDSEPMADGKTVQIGDAARLYAQSLIFLKGRYFVRIVAYRDSPQLQPALLDLGHGIEEKLTH